MRSLSMKQHLAVIAATGSLITLFACSGGEEAEKAPLDTQGQGEATSPSAAPQTPAPRVITDLDVTLDGPARVIRGHPNLLPEWADDLRDGINPENGDSWREKVAVRLEASCAELINALLDGDTSSINALTTGDFKGYLGLFPEFREIRFDDGSFVILDQKLEATDHEPLMKLLDRIDVSPWTALAERKVTASIVAIELVEEDTWKCSVELRLVGVLEGKPAMFDVELGLIAHASEESASPPHVRALSAEHSRLIRQTESSFRSISGVILEDLPYWQRDFALGCGDYDRRADRRGVPFGTGMLGMALGDVNGDGLEDIYVSMISGIPNRLLLHQADGSVIDGASAAGVDILDTTRGALLIDLDNDNDLDLCVSRQADLLIYWNDGKGKFSAPTFLDGPGTSPIYSLCAADPDLDGDLDVFCSRYHTGSGAENVPTPYHNAQNGVANLFWRNDGERRFTSAGEETGLTSGSPRYSFIGLWEDFDGDGKIDLYVVNDFGPNNLYINTEDGFVDRAEEMGMLDASTGMGISAADVELDGDLDFYVTNMFSAPGLRSISEPMYRDGDENIRPLHRTLADGMSLLICEAPGQFIEQGALAGVEHGGWAWGAVFYDWNLDGYPEIYVPNGFITGKNETDVETMFWRMVVGTTPETQVEDDDYVRGWTAMSSFNRMEGFSYNGNERNHAYLALGDGTYADVSPISDVDFIDDGRVAARCDWDNDGREDLVLVNRTGPRLRIIRNTHPNPGHRIVIELHGKSGSAEAVSARMRVTRSDGKVVRNTVYAGEGLLGQCSTRQFFGLGDSAGPVDVEVTWPDGEVQKFPKLAIDRGWNLYHTGQKSSAWAFDSSPFEGQAHSPAERNESGAQRVLLTDKMPLRYMTLHNLAGQVVALDELPKTTKLLTFWDPKSRAGLAFLKQLAKSQSEIIATGTTLCPVAMDGEDSDWSSTVKKLGLTEYALAASETEELMIEALLLEILSTYDEIALPLSFLLDAQSNLCAFYYGAIPTAELVDDLQRVGKMQPDDNSTLELSGGYWLVHPTRRSGRISRALLMLGQRDLASDLKKHK
ncbi:MAG: hypothetical protein ACI8X5_002772 [Planctomycetota bacterium]|jgi:hypothetical protein